MKRPSGATRVSWAMNRSSGPAVDWEPFAPTRGVPRAAVPWKPNRRVVAMIAHVSRRATRHRSRDGTERLRFTGRDPNEGAVP